MNIGALLLTGLIALVLVGSCVAIGSRMTWAIDLESNIFRAISRRNDERNYRHAENDE
jgi:hypothetical protein